MRIGTLFTLLSLAIAVSASPVLELRGGRPDGSSCRHDAICHTKSYCRHGSCSPKKPDGHVCYRDAGCDCGSCYNGKCGKKHPVGHPHPAPPSTHPHPAPHPAPHPGPAPPAGPTGPPAPPAPGNPLPPSSTSSTSSTAPQPSPTQPVKPPTQGVLSFVGSAPSLLGERDVGIGEVEWLEVVQQAQVWSLNNEGNLISPSGRVLLTDGVNIEAIGDEADVGVGFQKYVCSATSDSTNTQAVLDCSAPVGAGDGKSFSACYGGQIQTGDAQCFQVLTHFTQLTLTAS